jgi:asparagine synthase (glutamine-hydrolysing)
MWAFAWLDPKRSRVLLSRDRFGEKPLRLHRTGHGLYFASEHRALEALAGVRFRPDPAKLHRFIAHGYRGIFREPETFLAGVTDFSAAHAAWAGPDADAKPRPYWTPRFAPREMSAEEAGEEAVACIDRAIRVRLRADVPIAISLSGGIDSNVLAGIAVHRHGQRLHSFSMLEEDADYDESAAIRTAAAALGTPHHETRVSRAGFTDRLARMSRWYGGPVPSLGMYLDGFLSEAVADAGYKVLINGNGADEIFAGYYDHYLFRLADSATEDPEGLDARIAEWRDSHGRFIRNPMLQDPRRFIDTPGFRDHLHLNVPDVADLLQAPVARDFPETAYASELLRMRMLNELLSESVPVLTWAHDSHYMAHSIENRAAYLDRNLVDFMLSVPSRHLISGGLTKALLRRAGRGLVPPAILEARQKLGFNAPIAALLDRSDPDLRDRLLADSAFFDIVRRERFAALLDPARDSRGSDNLLFCLVSARLFHEAYD